MSLNPQENVSTLQESLRKMRFLPSIEAAFFHIRDELSEAGTVSYACNPDLNVMVVGRSYYQEEEEFGRALADPNQRTWSHVHLFEKHGIPYFDGILLPIIFGHIRPKQSGNNLEMSETESGILISEAIVTMDLNRGDVSPELAINTVKKLAPYFPPKTMLVCDPARFKKVLPPGGFISAYAERATALLNSSIT